MTRRPRPSAALAVAFVALFSSLAGGAVAARLLTGSDVRDGSLTGRDVRDRSLGLRDLSVAARRGTGRTGPAGAQGPQGRAGDPGPATGAAGGDLGGSFPNPVVAPGAITPPKEGPRPAATVFAPGTQTLAGNVGAPVVLQREAFDVGGLHSAAAPERLTAPLAGIYTAQGGVCWSASTSGVRDLTLAQVSPTPTLTSTTVARSVVPVPAALSTSCQGVSATVLLAAGDYMQLLAFHTAVGTLTVQSEASSLSLAWVGPPG